MRYWLTLPLRMAKAAAMVPLKDLDNKLGLTRATNYIEWWADSFTALGEEAAA